MNTKISVFVICVKATVYLLLYNLHDCTIKHYLCVFNSMSSSKTFKKFNYKLMFMIKTFLQRDFEFSKLPFHLYKKKCGTFTNLKSEKQND